MTLITADRVKDTTTTTGTGSVTLSGTAPTGYRTFASQMATGDTCWYCIDDGAGGWEIGLGTFTSPTTLARTTVYSSSNANAAVSFAAGTKSVFITAPAARMGGARYACGVAAADVLIPTGGAPTTLTFPAADLINEGWRSGTNNYVTAPASGLYFVTFEAQEDTGTAAGGIADCSVYIGTTATLVAAIYHATAYEIMTGSGVISLTAGDQVSVQARNNSSNTRRVILNNFSIKAF